MLNQMRLDICANNLSIAVVSRNAFQLLKVQQANTYRGALQAAAKEMSGNKFIQPGCSVVLTIWPDQVKIVPLPIGKDHPCKTVAELDARVQLGGQEFGLDPGFAYRALAEGRQARAEVLGLDMQGWDEVEQNISKGAYLHHYWGPLAVLEVLHQHFAPVFPNEDMLLGIADLNYLYCFHLDDGNLRGIRILERKTLVSVKPIGECLDSFGIEGEPKILLVSLTPEMADLRAIERDLSKDTSMIASAAGRQDLVKAFGMLRPGAELTQYPLGLLQGGLHGRL